MVVVPVTEQPLVVIVVDGEHVVVVVGNVEPAAVIAVGVHSIMTCSAVSVVVHDDELTLELVSVLAAELAPDVAEVAVDRIESVFWLALLLSPLSVRSSFCDVRSFKTGSTPSTSSALMTSVISPRFSSIQDRVPTTSLIGPSRPLLARFWAMHGLGEISPPRFEMRSSISLLT